MSRKTRIALQYAKVFKKSSRVSVFWVYAGTVDRFNNAYREIARKLKIPGCESPDSDIRKLVQNYLEDDRSGRWLMILDNADNADIMYGSGSLRLADYLPRSDQGSILLTTRFQKVGASFTSNRNVMSLQSMTLEESESLLRARLSDGFPGEDHDLYQELACELECTPLALVQAASFMSQNCIPLDVYLQLYRESDDSKIQLLSEDFEDDIRDCEAKNPIATTWIISFDYIRIQFPQAAELLSLMSIMDAQNIPEFPIPQGDDNVSFNKAIGNLEAFCFISTRRQSHSSLQRYRSFGLHRLVRLAIRNWLKLNGTLIQRTAQVLKLLAFRCSGGDSDNFEISSIVLPHVLELFASDLLQFEISPNFPFGLSDMHGCSLSDLYFLSDTTSDRTRDAVHLLEDVDAISELVKYTTHLAGYVTMAYSDIGRKVDARGFAVKSLAISSSILGQSREITMSSMGLLAFIVKDLGELELAEQLSRQRVSICEAEYGFSTSLH